MTKAGNLNSTQAMAPTKDVSGSAKHFDNKPNGSYDPNWCEEHAAACQKPCHKKFLTDHCNDTDHGYNPDDFDYDYPFMTHPDKYTPKPKMGKKK